MFNLQLYATAAGILMIVAGGALAYHEVVVSRQETKITHLTSQVATLTADNLVLKDNVKKVSEANLALQQSMVKFEEQSSKLTALMTEAAQRDEQIAVWFSEARSSLLSAEERRKMQELFRSDPSGSITAANTDLACMLTNFGKMGTCKEGKFISFGGSK